MCLQLPSWGIVVWSHCCFDMMQTVQGLSLQLFLPKAGEGFCGSRGVLSGIRKFHCVSRAVSVVRKVVVRLYGASDIWLTSRLMFEWAVIFSLVNPDCLSWLTSVLAVHRLGNRGLILLLFETPSGFAIFRFDGVQLFLPNAKEVLAYSFFVLLMYLLAQLIFPCHWPNFLDLLCLLQNI
jgi:hypothetical protein